MGLDFFDLLSPVKNGLLAAARPFVKISRSASLDIKDFFSGIVSLRSQLAKTRDLDSRVKILTSEVASLKLDKEENIKLREILSLKQRLPFSTQTASVVSADLTGFSGLITLDKGQRDGVSTGDAVIDEFGNFLGVVRETGVSFSKFLLVTDGSAKIEAMVPGKSALGVVTGSHGVGLSFDLISQDINLNQGDTVVTSGLSGRLPQGIVIGTLDKRDSSGSDLFQKITVIPAANVKMFKYVLVVTSY